MQPLAIPLGIPELQDSVDYINDEADEDQLSQVGKNYRVTTIKNVVDSLQNNQHSYCLPNKVFSNHASRRSAGSLV